MTSERLGFAVALDGTTHELVVSPVLSAAFDILTDDGYPPEKAADVLVIAERNGHNPEVFARKMVRLRKAMRA